jgi:DNA-binding transcriptional LysR family regulator
LTAWTLARLGREMQLRGVDTNLIIALRALLQHQNVTRAAKDVGLSQSSMSHALSRLRAHFHDPLLVPAGRELVLTERGKALIEPVADAVANLERVFAQAEPFDPRTSRRVFRIAATDNLALYVLPQLAATLHEMAPWIDVRVCALPLDWITALHRGDIDLKLGRRDAVPDALQSQDLSLEHFACVARRRHPARSRPSPQEYAAFEHLLVAPTAPLAAEPDGLVDALLAKQGLRRRVVMTVPHFLVAPFIVASSDLVLTAPARLLAAFTKLLGLRRIELPIKLAGYRLTQVWAARSRDDDAHRWLRGAVARALAASKTAGGGIDAVD